MLFSDKKCYYLRQGSYVIRCWVYYCWRKRRQYCFQHRRQVIFLC